MILIWGTNFAVVKRALEVFEPLGFNALRHLLASAFMLGVLRARGAISLPDRRDYRRIVALGIVGNVAYQLAFIYGLERTRAGNAGLMLALVPIFLLAFGRRESGSRRYAWIGALISIVGVALVSGTSVGLDGTEALIGDAILVGAAAVWAIYTMGSGTLILRYGPLRTTAWTLLVGSVGLFLLGIPSLLRQDWTVVTPEAWAAVLFSGLFAIGVAYLLWYRGVQRLGGARTAIFSNLTPVVALVTGAIWLGETLTRYSVSGAVLAIGGLLLVRAGSQR